MNLLRSNLALAIVAPLLTPLVPLHAAGRADVPAKLAAALEPQVTGCEWQDGFRFSDFVRTRSYDSRDVNPFCLPGMLRYFDVDEL